MNISVREMLETDIESIVDYFIDADEEYLRGMGAEKSKLPQRDAWISLLEKELIKGIEEKEFYYILWLLDGKAIGHSNINKIEYGSTATMHLHLWQNIERRKGLGSEFLKKAIPLYFSNFELKVLVCEPFAGNPAPNKVLGKLGFEFIEAYDTTPGWINFFQTVNRYEMSREQFEYLEAEVWNNV